MTVRIYAAVTAVTAMLAWFALALQCCRTVTLSISNGKTLVAGLISFFSYFTILTNLLAAVVLSCSARAPKAGLGGVFASVTVQSETAVYIAIVGIVYSLLPRHIWNP